VADPSQKLELLRYIFPKAKPFRMKTKNTVQSLSLKVREKKG
jgi:hypothetical protein